MTYTSQFKLLMNILTNPEENPEEAQKTSNNLAKRDIWLTTFLFFQAKRKIMEFY